MRNLPEKEIALVSHCYTLYEVEKILRNTEDVVFMENCELRTFEI
jgi:hypothetical protein